MSGFEAPGVLRTSLQIIKIVTLGNEEIEVKSARG